MPWSPNNPLFKSYPNFIKWFFRIFLNVSEFIVELNFKRNGKISLKKSNLQFYPSGDSPSGSPSHAVGL